MPLSTATTWFADSVPAWAVTGLILMGGYTYDKSSTSDERLATLETKTSAYEEDVREIKHSLERVEDYILTGKGHE